MTESEMRLHRCCFTGHRPEKMKMTEAEIKPLLLREIKRATSEGYTTFITGMAPGVDIWAAEIVLELNRHDESIRLIAAVPYPGFGKTRDYKRNLTYKRVIERADLVRKISPCLLMQKSNDEKY